MDILNNMNNQQLYINKVKLMIKYDTLKTLNENILEQPVGYPVMTDADYIKIEKDKEEKIKKEINFNKNYFTIKVPNSQTYKAKDIILPKSVNNNKTKYTLFTHPINPDIFFKSWIGIPSYEQYIPSSNDLNYIFPEGTLRSFTIDDIQYKPSVNRVSDEPIKYEFKWYYDKDNNPYIINSYINKEEIPDKYIFKDGWWDEWGMTVIQIGGTLIIGLATAGIGTIVEASVAAIFWTEAALQAGFNVAIGAKELKEGKNFSATMSFIFAILPIVGKLTRIGYVSKEMSETIAKKIGISQIDSAEELAKKIATPNLLSEDEMIIVKKVIQLSPQDWINTTKKFMNQVESELVKQGKSLKDVKVPFLKKHFTKDLGFQIGTMGAAGVVADKIGIKNPKPISEPASEPDINKIIKIIQNPEINKKLPPETWTKEELKW